MSETRRAAVRMVALQVDDYGPWTTTPAPRRETDLQAMQARLFADFADFVGGRDGYAFAGRYDNMVAVATGVEPETFERFQERVRNRYPVTVSVGVGTASTPAAALAAAGEVLQAAGSAQTSGRREVLGHRETDEAAGRRRAVTIAHFDVVDATRTYTDQRAPMAVELSIRRAVLSLSEFLHENHGCVTQFVGGDNAIAVCPRLVRDDVDAATEHVRRETGVDLQVGVGHGSTAYEAGNDAKHALEACRESGDRVRGPWKVADD